MEADRPPTLEIIELYVAITDKIIAGTPNYTPTGKQPRLQPTADGPQFIGRLTTPDRPIDPVTFYQRMVGRKPAANGRKGAPPLIAKPDGRGYSPHTLRHRTMQNVAAALRSQEVDGIEVEPKTFAHALLDHELTADLLGYLDFNDPYGRARLSGIAARANHDLLATAFIASAEYLKRPR